MTNQNELFENLPSESEKKSDWTGNKISSYVMNGCSNHSEKERQNEDYYATDPRAVEKLLEKESFHHRIWENACGGCHITNVLLKHGYDVYSTDIVDRKNSNQDSVMDFLKCTDKNLYTDIITNPPYKYAKEFVEKSLDVIQEGFKVAMFLKLTFLEGGARKTMFEKYPPKKIYVFSKRVNCAKNGNEKEFNESSAVCYAWFVWEKGYTGLPVIDWI